MEETWTRIKEIEESLKRTMGALEETERLSFRKTISNRLVCNKCHVCRGGCSKIPVFSKSFSKAEITKKIQDKKTNYNILNSRNSTPVRINQAPSKKPKNKLLSSYKSTSTLADSNFVSLSKELSKTNSNFKRLERKIILAEKILKDKHCAKCLG